MAFSLDLGSALQYQDEKSYKEKVISAQVWIELGREGWKERCKLLQQSAQIHGMREAMCALINIVNKKDVDVGIKTVVVDCLEQMCYSGTFERIRNMAQTALKDLSNNRENSVYNVAKGVVVYLGLEKADKR